MSLVFLPEVRLGLYAHGFLDRYRIWAWECVLILNTELKGVRKEKVRIRIE